MTCTIKDRNETINRYLAGTLSEKERESFDLHCFECPECFRELRLQEEMTTLVRKEGPVLFADVLRKQKKTVAFLHGFLDKLVQPFMIPKFRWSFVTLVFTLILLCLFTLKHDNHSNLGPVSFETQPYLEEMISDVMRSESVRIISPENAEVVDKRIIFNWEGTEEKPLDLIILNNRAEEVVQYQATQNPYEMKLKLKPGLYYWKLENSRDLLCMGKFIVR